MYQPPAFREDDLDVQRAFIRECPLGLLFTASSEGLAADPIPFLLDGEGSERGRLRGHLSRANPQVSALKEVEECLVAFLGPQAYITPSWYATKRETSKVVPTWNYATVHVWGRPSVIDEEAWIRRQIEDLTAHLEGPREKSWAVQDAPEDFLRAQIKGIVGVEIAITRIEGKWKASQNRSEPDRQGVATGLREQGAVEMASIVEARGDLGSVGFAARRSSGE